MRRQPTRYLPHCGGPRFFMGWIHPTLTNSPGRRRVRHGWPSERAARGRSHRHRLRRTGLRPRGVRATEDRPSQSKISMRADVAQSRPRPRRSLDRRRGARPVARGRGADHRLGQQLPQHAGDDSGYARAQPGASREFDAWLEAVAADTREEHLLPLHVVAGAAAGEPRRKMLEDHVMGTVESAFEYGGMEAGHELRISATPGRTSADHALCTAHPDQPEQRSGGAPDLQGTRIELPSCAASLRESRSPGPRLWCYPMSAHVVRPKPSWSVASSPMCIRLMTVRCT